MKKLRLRNRLVEPHEIVHAPSAPSRLKLRNRPQEVQPIVDDDHHIGSPDWRSIKRRGKRRSTRL
jgi:hypothetical protein